jgi:hypothetical protein
MCSKNDTEQVFNAKTSENGYPVATKSFINGCLFKDKHEKGCSENSKIHIRFWTRLESAENVN